MLAIDPVVYDHMKYLKLIGLNERVEVSKIIGILHKVVPQALL